MHMDIIDEASVLSCAKKVEEADGKLNILINKLRSTPIILPVKALPHRLQRRPNIFLLRPRIRQQENDSVHSWGRPLWAGNDGQLGRCVQSEHHRAVLHHQSVQGPAPQGRGRRCRVVGYHQHLELRGEHEQAVCACVCTCLLHRSIIL